MHLFGKKIGNFGARFTSEAGIIISTFQNADSVDDAINVR